MMPLPFKSIGAHAGDSVTISLWSVLYGFVFTRSTQNQGNPLSPESSGFIPQTLGKNTGFQVLSLDSYSDKKSIILIRSLSSTSVPWYSGESHVRPVPGVLPPALAAKRKGLKGEKKNEQYCCYH